MDDSLALHTDGRGDLSLERQLLHAAIIEDVLEDAISASGRPTVVFLAGGPASGKSTLMERLGLAAGAVVIDVDAIRLRLPEYTEWRDAGRDEAAALTQREARDIAARAWGAALELGCNVVVDAVGGDDRGQFSGKINTALERGLPVRVVYATVDVEDAVRRAEQRYRDTGRGIEEAVLRAKHAEVSRGIEHVARLAVDSIEVYDTSGPVPQLLAHGPGGQGLDGLEVVDCEGYAAFLRKGQA